MDDKLHAQSVIIFLSPFCCLLWTFALIVSAHSYCARKFTPQVIHQAIASAIALRGSSELESLRGVNELKSPRLTSGDLKAFLVVFSQHPAGIIAPVRP